MIIVEIKTTQLTKELEHFPGSFITINTDKQYQ